MKARNIICFEFKKEERIYRLEMPHGAPLGEAYEVAFSFLKEMVQLINEQAEAAKPKEENEDAAKQDSSKGKKK